MACIISGYFVLVMAVLRLAMEVLDFVNEVFIKADEDDRAITRVLNGLKKYVTSPANAVEILLYGSAIFFSLNVLPMFDTEVMSPFQWEIGILCVFMAFINLLLILEVVPPFGLHIIMFIRIFKTFVINIAVLLGFFILMFVVIFHMVFGQSPIFRDVSRSIYKALSMGVSGVGYEDYDMKYDMEEDAETVNYPASALGMLIAFVVFVQVLFLNLATGLAIEDVQDIRKNAEAEMNATKIELIYHSERMLSALQSVLSSCGIVKENQFLGNQKRFHNMSPKDFRRDEIEELKKRKATRKQEIYR